MPLADRLKPLHLRLLLRIAETGKLQDAAATLGLSQPAASRILREIERDTGGPLFRRHPRGMTATDLGAAVLRHARLVLTGLEDLEAEVALRRGGAAGRVAVGAVTGPAVGCLLPAVAELKAAAPRLEVSVEVAPSAQLLRALVEGRLDFMLGRVPPGHPADGLELLPGRHERVDLLVHDSHPLAGRPDVPLAETRGFPWVLEPEGAPIRTAVETAFRDAGEAQPENVTDSAALLVALALLRAGPAIAPQTREVCDLLTGLGARLRVLPLETPIVVPTVYLVRPRGRAPGPAAERLMQAVLARL